MNVEKELALRSESKCELCGASENLIVYTIPPANEDSADKSILICDTCLTQIENPDQIDTNHWRCLNDSMWSQIPAVQVMAWRMLTRLRHEGWPQDLLDMLYLDDDTLTWAKASGEGVEKGAVKKHMDSNGVELLAGDTVVITKDLVIKGSQFAAKRGTSVRNIALVHDNHEQIEGRVNDQTIVILTKFVKKTS